MLVEGREDEKMQDLYLQDPKIKQTVLAQGFPGSREAQTSCHDYKGGCSQPLTQIASCLYSSSCHDLYEDRSFALSLLDLSTVQDVGIIRQMTIRSGEWLLDQQDDSLAWGTCSLIL